MAHRINDAAFASRKDWTAHRGDWRRIKFAIAIGGRYSKTLKELRDDMRQAAFAYGQHRGWF